MDDASTDGTAAIVEAMARADLRVRLQRAPQLPGGWNGKQHACWALANAARSPLLCFVDADVRLEPDALCRMAAFLQARGTALVSGFPRQITVTWLEALLLPMIHFVLLGFLPLWSMRRSLSPALAAGCGQILMVRREAYFLAGGHAAIRETMHDGLLLPRALRRAGYATDLADITGLARCRMYTNAGEVWNGLVKNATEGLAAPARIVPVSVFLLLGQVLPFVLLGVALGTHSRFATIVLCLAAILVVYLPRLLAAARFLQPWWSALLHPVGILALLAVQWSALLRLLFHRPVRWRSRDYVPGSSDPAR